jgi:hypothetical protein
MADLGNSGSCEADLNDEERAVTPDGKEKVKLIGVPPE